MKPFDPNTPTLHTGHPDTPRKMGTPTATKFLAHAYCGQMAGWMKTLLASAWYGNRPRPRPHCTRRSPSSRERGTAAPRRGPSSRERGTAAPWPLFGHVYCGVATVRGRPSQLLLSAELLCKRPAATQSAQIRELSSDMMFVLRNRR